MRRSVQKADLKFHKTWVCEEDQRLKCIKSLRYIKATSDNNHCPRNDVVYFFINLFIFLGMYIVPRAHRSFSFYVYIYDSEVKLAKFETMRFFAKVKIMIKYCNT